MDKFYVTEDIAEKLQAKGYPYSHIIHFDNGVPIARIDEVLAWLREEKDMDLVIYPIFIYKAEVREKEYHCKISAPQLNKPIPTDEYRNCYEFAALDGIKYVLDNLI